jgi:dihydroorotate dehydrogenase
MYQYLRPLLFQLDPESAHILTLNLIRVSGMIPGLRDAIRRIFHFRNIPVDAFGLKFKNPVGLAAGYDKDGIGWQGLSLLGFGHIELGTVTPLPQPGNPRPRIFRFVGEGGLVNRMGFPGRGADYLEDQILNKKHGDLILGVNIGKNANTPVDSAVEDYRNLINRFAGLADYLVINISSPNTIGLRRLQARTALDELLATMVDARKEQENQLNKKVPLLVKLSPDLTEHQLKDAVDVILHHELDGVVATNTSSELSLLNDTKTFVSGGVSGKPINSLSTEIVGRISAYSKGNLPIIGVGGISSVSDANAKLDAGAILIQIYTGLVYQGPGLVKNILQGLHH